jgi:hypothetical protein
MSGNTIIRSIGEGGSSQTCSGNQGRKLLALLTAHQKAHNHSFH